MKLLLYNTLSRKKEEFKPLKEGFVTIYACGVTPYSKSHLGHLRFYLAVDTLKRVLNFLGYNVFSASNFTDIDDKIIKASLQTGKDWREIANENIEYTLKMLKMANCLNYDVYPRVTEYINEIIEFVSTLVKKGFAYVTPSGVYFEVDKFRDYGKLSKRTKDFWDQKEEFLKDKKKSYDFALWKARKENEPYWPSPFGDGRPGWHIECSTMCINIFGDYLDIHAGGNDLIFPHHENEIAQSEAYLGKEWVRYWFHTGMFMLNKEKMSKSIGNVINAIEFMQENGTKETRYYLVSKHYRDPFEYSDESFSYSKEEFKRITATISKVFTYDEVTYKASKEEISFSSKVLDTYRGFISAILDDIDMTVATARLNELVKFANIALENNNTVAINLLKNSFKVASFIYGLWEDIVWKREEKYYLLLKDVVNTILEIREKFREKREYEISDMIRKELENVGIKIEDTKEGARWYVEE